MAGVADRTKNQLTRDRNDRVIVLWARARTGLGIRACLTTLRRGQVSLSNLQRNRKGQLRQAWNLKTVKAQNTAAHQVEVVLQSGPKFMRENPGATLWKLTWTIGKCFGCSVHPFAAERGIRSRWRGCSRKERINFTGNSRWATCSKVLGKRSTPWGAMRTRTFSIRPIWSRNTRHTMSTPCKYLWTRKTPSEKSNRSPFP